MTSRSTLALKGSNPGKGERTFGRIRQAALDLFSRLGFERVTMAEIAAAAGVSQPALHYHFEDKGQLWRSAMGLLSEAIAAEERLMAAAADASAILKMQMAMRHFLHLAWDHPALGRIVALEGMAGGARLDWLIDHVIGRRNLGLIALIREAIAAGDLKPYPPEQILILLQTGAVGAVNMAPLMRANFGYEPDGQDARDAYEALVIDTMVAGLAPNKKTDRPGS